MTTTYTGRLLVPNNLGVPSLLDMAVQSARIARFAGAHRVRLWSVGHHLVVGDALLHMMFGVGETSNRPTDRRAPLRGFFLTHDSDEMASGDVPTLWKPPGLRRWTRRLQENVWRYYVGRVPTDAEEAAVKQVDRLALRAEAEVVGPPGVMEHSGLEAWRWRDDAVDSARDTVRNVMRAFPSADDAHDPEGYLVTRLLELFQSAGLEEGGAEQ